MVALAFVASWVPWFAGALSPWLLLTALAAPLAVPLVAIVRSRADGPSLNHALAGSARLALTFCILLCAGVLAS
jgi:1,4-dihydroxy-2-naphthoate octaprenyltransferase